MSLSSSSPSHPRRVTVFVTGATGTQGTQVIKELLLLASNQPTTHQLTIHALVRDPNSAASKALVSLDSGKVRLFQGDFDDVAALARGAASCTTTFLNVSPSFTDPGAERRHASNILSASLSAGVRHVILSSTNGCHKYRSFKNLPSPDTFMGNYFVSKSGIIDMIKQPPFPTPEYYTWTVLQPATLLSNFLPPGQSFMYPKLASPNPTIETAHRPDLQLSYLDPADIGRFAARAAFSVQEQPPSKSDLNVFVGRIIPLASVDMTMSDVAAALSRAVENRKVVTVKYLSEKEAQAAKDANPLVPSQLFQNDNPCLVDLEEVRSYNIPLGDVDEYFNREKARVEQALGL